MIFLLSLWAYGLNLDARRYAWEIAWASEKSVDFPVIFAYRQMSMTHFVQGDFQ
jgi:hypothetical protein